MSRRSMKSVLEEAGLGALLDPTLYSARELAYIEEATETQLVFQYGRIAGMLEDPDLSPKEIADLTLSLGRIKTIIDKHRGTSKGASAARAASEGMAATEEAERIRLNVLAKKFGTGNMFARGE